MMLEWDQKRYLLDFFAIEHGNFLETAWLSLYHLVIFLSLVALLLGFLSASSLSKEYSSIIEDIRALAIHFDISFSQVKRAANRMTDWLARSALRHGKMYSAPSAKELNAVIASSKEVSLQRTLTSQAKKNNLPKCVAED
ncbi:hypothetical protein LguiB_028152 [Lonicera macranthoides]